MSDYVKNTGRLAGKKLEAGDMAIKIRGLVDSIHAKADPFENLIDLETDIIASQSMELARVMIDYRGILDEMAALKKALGR